MGARINLAGERIASYMNDTNGWRAVGAGAADWKLNRATILKGDFEYQHKVERDGSGYQFLGGTRCRISTNLSLHHARRPGMGSARHLQHLQHLGARLDHTSRLTGWPSPRPVSVTRSFKTMCIYAYGTSFDANGNSSTVPARPMRISSAPDGTYGIYDYRDPGELRIGRRRPRPWSPAVPDTGAIDARSYVLGGRFFSRSVQQPGEPPANAPSTVADGAVY